ncbi:MAG TPA: hypothetical protein VEW46_25180 [Pyrinomonadaceae bacterium]|nr:hypothetical protein [Pyrinomonadaceae bacterium]
MSQENPGPKPLLDFSVLSYTSDQLSIKVKNVSGAVLDKTLSIEMNPLLYLLSPRFDDPLEKAPFSRKPTGAVNIASLVTGPEGCTVWLRRESSDSSVYIVLFNDLDQAGDRITPIKVPANAEFTIRIPLDPNIERGNDDFLYSYQHGTLAKDLRFDGKLELKSGSTTWNPDVTFWADSPMMVEKPGDPVTISWDIADGVSGTLRGPLPGGNPELPLSTIPGEPFQLSKGSLTVRVVGPITFILQAEVKHSGNPNFQVVKMLSFDTPNHKYLYVDARPDKVLPFGLVEIDWAAWGVEKVTIEVGTHTTRVIPLTQQTLGRFYEGTGVMRISATKSDEIDLKATAINKATTGVKVLTWDKMDRFDYKTALRGMIVIAPYMALLTAGQLYHGVVGTVDPELPMTALPLVKKTGESTLIWQAIAAVENRFVCMRRNNTNFEVVAFTREGEPEDFPPLTLPPEFAPPALSLSVDRDFVGFDKRAYLVAEAPLGAGIARRAYSIRFNSDSKKVDYRREPALERLIGYRLVSCDGALYALNRQTGDMLRFELKANGELDTPVRAAPAIKKDEENGNQAESMIAKGLIVPVGRVLVVFNPTSVPSVASLEKYGLKNTVKPITSTGTSPQTIPQDLFYNPQKNYWGRCGRDPQTKTLVDYYSVAAFRGGDSPRLWVLQPSGDPYTLAVGEETVFVHDYMPGYPTKALPPPVAKKRMFSVECMPIRVMPITDTYRRLGLVEFSTADLTASVPSLPRRDELQFSFDLTYDENNPAPVTIRQQVKREPRELAWPADVEYLLEVIFSGPDLASATSCYRRLKTTQGNVTNDEVFGSRMVHSSYSTIKIPRPARFVDRFRFVVVNTCKNFRVKMKGWNNYNILEQEAFPVDHFTPDFGLAFEGRIATEGIIGVNLDFALPHGIESSRSDTPQTKMIRLTTDNAQKMQILLATILMPDDAPLNLAGGTAPIEPVPGRPVYVVQLDYKM